MADSLQVEPVPDAVPAPISRLKTGPKTGHKNLLSDDVKLKLAEHISSDLDVRYVLLIPGKRNKQHITAELLDLINEYLTPVHVTKHTLNKWLADCIVESVEWEARDAGDEEEITRATRSLNRIRDEIDA